MNRRQRDANRENAKRLSVVVAEHEEYPVYPNGVLIEEQTQDITNQILDNAIFALPPSLVALPPNMAALPPEIV